MLERQEVKMSYLEIRPCLVLIASFVGVGLLHYWLGHHWIGLTGALVVLIGGVGGTWCIIEWIFPTTDYKKSEFDWFGILQKEGNRRGGVFVGWLTGSAVVAAVIHFTYYNWYATDAVFLIGFALALYMSETDDPEDDRPQEGAYYNPKLDYTAPKQGAVSCVY
jgi:hypothetical protein